MSPITSHSHDIILHCLEDSSNHSVQSDDTGLTDDCASKFGGLALSVLSTPPSSLAHSVQNRGGSVGAALPYIPDTREADPPVNPPKILSERSAWRTRFGLSATEANQPRSRNYASIPPQSLSTIHRTKPKQYLGPRRRTTRGTRLPLSSDVMASSFSSRRNVSATTADEHEDSLPEASSTRPTARCQVLRSLPDPAPGNALGLDLNASPVDDVDTRLPPSPCGGLGLYSPLPRASRSRRVNGLLCSPLQILIPQPLGPEGYDNPSRPVTALYYPRTNVGDLCPSPEEESSLFADSRLPEALPHIAVGESPSVQLAAGDEPAPNRQPATYSPHSPPPLAHPAYIPLPSESPVPDLSRRSSPVEASFRMLQLHDGSGTGLHVVRGRVEQLENGDVRLVANLPQEVTVELLSPIRLTSAPSFQLEDLTERISHCQDAMDWIYLVSVYGFCSLMLC